MRFKINEDDIGTNVSFFAFGVKKNWIFVCTKIFYDKQDQSIKNNNIRPIGNTGYYACYIEKGDLLGKDEFEVESVKGEPSKFSVTRIINLYG
jgi:hypothetical protein